MLAHKHGEESQVAFKEATWPEYWIALSTPKTGGCRAGGWLGWSCHPDDRCSFVSPDKPPQSLLELKGGCLDTQRTAKNISTKRLHFGVKSSFWDIFALTSITCRGIKKEQLFAGVGPFLLSFHCQLNSECFHAFLGRMREIASVLPQFSIFLPGSWCIFSPY